MAPEVNKSSPTCYDTEDAVNVLHNRFKFPPTNNTLQTASSLIAHHITNNSMNYTLKQLHQVSHEGHDESFNYIESHMHEGNDESSNYIKSDMKVVTSLSTTSSFTWS